jgi:hypothetical protein
MKRCENASRRMRQEKAIEGLKSAKERELLRITVTDVNMGRMVQQHQDTIIHQFSFGTIICS